MVHKLQPINKKRKKGGKDSASNISRGPRAGSCQPIRRSHHRASPGDKPSIHAVNNRRKNAQFEARTNENVYIKCQIDQCPIFMHGDSAYYYMSNVCC